MGCHLARTLELKLVEDTGFSRRYTWCLQVYLKSQQLILLKFENNFHYFDRFIIYSYYNCLTDC